LVAAAVRDISRRKRAAQRQQVLEAKLRQSQKLESMGVLAGGIAHDFNNLLMGVLGNADVVMRHLPDASPARDGVGNIISAAMHAADLTKQMLAYSGKGKFVVEPIDLGSLVRQIGNLLDASISKNVDVSYEFADGLPAIDADASQVQQVVMNLIINASEALDGRDGEVVVRTSIVQVDESYFSGTYFAEDLPVGSYVCLEVSDTGCGMDEQMQQKIFDPFFSTKFSGRGLGLAAVLGIIKGHDGALRIRSRPNEGSTFTVLFPPSSRPLAAAGGQQPSAAPWRGSGTVLVVDDVETVRDATKRMIETHGYSVITADDGDVAIDVFREHFRDIVAVVLDLTMPRMGGEQTFNELRRIDPGVKVILSSGFDETETTSRFAGHGLAGFIQKPYRVDRLADALRMAVDGP
jgi:nitrogen-specific signal transduction histidine kinase/CheY-like chemotaxis protein